MFRISPSVYRMLPIYLLFFGQGVSFIQGGQSGHSVYGTLLKTISIFWMLANIVWSRRVPRFPVFMFLTFLLFLHISIYMSYDLRAAIEAYVRYLFLPVILIYGYVIRDDCEKVLLLIIRLAILSDMFQVVVYITNWAHVQFIVDPVIKDGLYIINLGFLGVPNFLLNLSAYVLSRVLGKHFHTIFFSVFIVLTFSYKTIFSFVIISFMLSKSKIKWAVVAVLLGSGVYFGPYSDSIASVIKKRLEYYFIVGNSARYESYRVMFESLSEWHPFGEGVGNFGGPASTKYHSPLYRKYEFDWYWLEGYLTTTDTFYPHLFVEVGGVAGILYLIIPWVVVSFMREKVARRAARLLLLALYIESVMSFGMQNQVTLACTIMLIYPLYQYLQFNNQMLLYKSFFTSSPRYCASHPTAYVSGPS